MKKLFKKLALAFVAVLTLSVGTGTVREVKAADTTITFALGANGEAKHSDGNNATSSYSETVNGYELSITNGTNMYPEARDAKGNSCLKLGTSKKAGSFTISEVPTDVVKVLIYVAAYKAKTATVKCNSKTISLQNKSDNGTYDEILVDTSTTKTISFAVSSGLRCMINTIEFVVPESSGGEIPGEPTEKTDEQKVAASLGEFSALTDKEFYSSSTKVTLPLVDETNETTISYKVTGNTNVYSYNAGSLAINPVDALETATVTATFTSGEATATKEYLLYSVLKDSTLTIADATSIANVFDNNTYTTDKYYIVGNIDNISNEKYGNSTICDETGSLYVYGLYSDDGSTLYENMTTKPVVGDTVKLYGVLGKYNSTPQMKSGWVIEIITEQPVTPELSNEELIKEYETKTSLSFDYSLTESTEKGYSMINSESELEIGDSIIIAAVSEGKTYALGTNQKSSNREGVEFNVDEPGENVQIITLEEGSAEGSYSFKVDEGYLYAASTSGNQLKTKTEVDGKASWNIEVKDGKVSVVAVDSSVRGVLQFNPNNGSPLFACYASASQTAVSIYRLKNKAQLNSIDNVSLLFGATVDSTLFDNYSNVSGGVKISAGSKTIDCPVSLVKDDNGNYITSIGVIFELFADNEYVTPNTKGRLSQEITAVVYFVVDGLLLELQSTTVSVASMVNTYLSEYSTNPTVLNHIDALKALNAYIKA